MVGLVPCGLTAPCTRTLPLRGSAGDVESLGDFHFGRQMRYILLSIPALLYGWWCFFRTDQAQHFPQGKWFYENRPFSKSANFTLTKFHGVFSLGIGGFLLVYGFLSMLGIIRYPIQ